MKIIAGVDEVGRGSLIGPVYAAAVILNKSINIKLINIFLMRQKTQRIKVHSQSIHYGILKKNL